MLVCVRMALTLDFGLQDIFSETVVIEGQPRVLTLRQSNGTIIREFNCGKWDLGKYREHSLAADIGVDSIKDVVGTISGRNGEKRDRLMRLNPAQDDYIELQIDDSIYTFADVVFEADDVREGVEEHTDRYIDCAIDTINRFIAVYRLATSCNGLSVSSYRSPAILVGICPEGNLNSMEDVERAEFRHISTKIKLKETDEHVEDFRHLSKETEGKIRAILLSGSPISLEHQFLLAAKEQTFALHAYSVAIVTMQTAFEVWLREELKNTCRNINISTLSWRKKEFDYETAVESGDIVDDLIKDFCKQICGVSAATLVEYQSWRTDCYDKRNSVIHRGKLDHSSEESAQAFEACEKYKRSIRKLLAKGSQQEFSAY